MQPLLRSILQLHCLLWVSSGSNAKESAHVLRNLLATTPTPTTTRARFCEEHCGFQPSPSPSPVPTGLPTPIPTHGFVEVRSLARSAATGSKRRFECQEVVNITWVVRGSYANSMCATFDLYVYESPFSWPSDAGREPIFTAATNTHHGGSQDVRTYSWTAATCGRNVTLQLWCTASFNDLTPSFFVNSAPTASPSTSLPTPQPSISLEPTVRPATALPTRMPTPFPSFGPTGLPTLPPTLAPSPRPTPMPTIPARYICFEIAMPTALPTLLPTPQPSMEPTLVPSRLPTSGPTAQPTLRPTLVPSALPSLEPTQQPSTLEPTVSLSPSLEPTLTPSSEPTLDPTPAPTSCTIQMLGFDSYGTRHLECMKVINITWALDGQCAECDRYDLYLFKLPNTAASQATAVAQDVLYSDLSQDVRSYEWMASTCNENITFQVHCSIAVQATSPSIYVAAMHAPTRLPTLQPSSMPTMLPTPAPSLMPTSCPTAAPTLLPSSLPTLPPTALPTFPPTLLPSSLPTLLPTELPTPLPTLEPTWSPTLSPTGTPTIMPTLVPTRGPTLEPTGAPSMSPNPTAWPTLNPTSVPTFYPSASPTLAPSLVPTGNPTLAPTGFPSFDPTLEPTVLPTLEPTPEPSLHPSALPTLEPSLAPTLSPTILPTALPTFLPTMTPTQLPTLSPTMLPSAGPTIDPTHSPTIEPSSLPTSAPTMLPSGIPSALPSLTPTMLPSPVVPSAVPTLFPTQLPSLQPSAMPSHLPTAMPSHLPTISPSAIPSARPTLSPTSLPTLWPTIDPTGSPTLGPTLNPTLAPSLVPTQPSPSPTLLPTAVPTMAPTDSPTRAPSLQPSFLPTLVPSSPPSFLPTTCILRCITIDTEGPTGMPSLMPTARPSMTPPPSFAPTSLPSTRPTSSFAPTKDRDPYGPPLIVWLSIGTTWSQTSRVDAASKVTLTSMVNSTDPSTVYSWNVTSFFRNGHQLKLEYGTTVTTPLTYGNLVLKPGVLYPGETYVFMLTATNSHGAEDTRLLNVTAAIPPFGGIFNVTPSSGTTMTTLFNFSTANWTRDDDLPLIYSFTYYISGSSAPGYLQTGVSKIWCTSTLPMGSSSDFDLLVGVSVSDSVGASGSTNMTVTVKPPAMSNAISLAAAEKANIESKAASGEVISAALLAQSGATLLNYVLDSDDDAAAAGSSNALTERSNYIGVMTTIAAYVDSVTAVQSSAIAMEMLTATATTSLSSDDENNALGVVSTLVSWSSGERSMTSQAATAIVEVLSNLVTSGVLKQSSLSRKRGRTLLSTPSSPQAVMYSALKTLGDILAEDMVAGEDPVVHVTDNFAMRTSVVSKRLLANLNGMTVEAPVARTSSSATGTPSFHLPYSLLKRTGLGTDEEVSLVALSWLENPFADNSVSSALSAGSYVSSLWVYGDEIYGLKDPIRVSLPLPSTASLKMVDNDTTYHLNCGGTNMSSRSNYMTKMDFRRSAFCDEPGRVHRTARSKMNVVRTTQNVSQTFFCESTPRKNYTISCANASGHLNFTCPKQRSVESCQHWSGSSNDWTATNCSFWYVDEIAMRVVCNCTRLGSFSAQQRVLLEEYPLAYEPKMRKSMTATAFGTLADPPQNVGTLILLAGLWFLALLWVVGAGYLRCHEILRIPHLPDFQAKLQSVDAIFNGTKSSDGRTAVLDSDVEAPIDSRKRFWRGDGDYQDCTIDTAARNAVEDKLVRMSSVGWNWLRTMAREHELLVLYFGHNRNDSRRTFILLFCKMVSILALVCLSAPDRYLCSDDNMIRAAFIEFPQISTFLEYVTFTFKEKLVLILVSTLWIIPVLWTVTTAFFYSDLVHQSHILDEKYFLEDIHGAILNPEDISSSIHAKVALRLLRAADRLFRTWGLFFSALKKVYASRMIQKVLYPQLRKWSVEVMKYPSAQEGRFFNYADFDSIAQDVQEYSKTIKDVSVDISKRLAAFEVGERSVGAHRNYLDHEKHEAVATLPMEAHNNYLRHQLVLRSFHKSSSVVRWLKIWCYQASFMDDVCEARPPYASMSNLRLVSTCRLLFTISFLAMVVGSAYIIWFTLAVKDTLVVRNILMSFATVLAVEILIAEPVRKFLRAGAFPFFSWIMVAGEIHLAYGLGTIDKGEEIRVALPKDDAEEPPVVNPMSMGGGDLSADAEEMEKEEEEKEQGMGDSATGAEEGEEEDAHDGASDTSDESDDGASEPVIHLTDGVDDDDDDSIIGALEQTNPMHSVATVHLVENTDAQGAWDSPFHGRPLDLVGWAGPNYLVFDLGCCHQCFMTILCRSEGIEPPESLMDSMRFRYDLREELVTFYEVDMEAIKALMNRLTYGCDASSWKLQFGVEKDEDHPFVEHFSEDMSEICGKLRTPHHFNDKGEPVDHRRHNGPLTVRTSYIQTQVLQCIKDRLADRWGFDPDYLIELFDAVLVTQPDGYNLHKEVKGSERRYVEVLDDLVDCIEEEFNCWVAVAIKLPRGKELVSTREFEPLEGSLESLQTSVPCGKEYLDFDLMAGHFTCLMVLCQIYAVKPPRTLTECISNRMQLRRDLSLFYEVSIFAVKALLNRLVDGGTSQGWKIDFIVAKTEDHPFILQFQEDLEELAGRIQAQEAVVARSRRVEYAEYKYRSWIPSIYYIREQIISRVLSRLSDEHGFDVSSSVLLFDGFALTHEDATVTDIESSYSSYASQHILNDVAKFIWDTSSIWIGLSLKFPGGKVIPGSENFEVVVGEPSGIISRPERTDATRVKKSKKPKKPKKKKKKKKKTTKTNNNKNEDINKSKDEEEYPSAGDLRGLVLLQARVRGALVRESQLVNAKNLAVSGLVLLQARVRGALVRESQLVNAKNLAVSENAAYEGLGVRATEVINTPEDPLQSFLTKHGLARYHPRLAESPYNTLESLQQPDLTDAFLTGFVGMKKLHVLKFRKSIAELA